MSKVGQHRVADLVDPVQVLNDIDRRGLAGQRRGIDQRSQPPPPRIRIDLGQLHLGISDAHQVIEEHHVLRVGIGDFGPHLDPGSRGVQITHPGGCTQQPRHDVKRDVTGVRFAEGSEHLDTPGRCHCGDLAHQAALADAG